MNVVLIFGLLAVVLFGSAFVTRRRFGLLGLALAAGSILSGLWGYDAGPGGGQSGYFSVRSTHHGCYAVGDCRAAGCFITLSWLYL